MDAELTSHGISQEDCLALGSDNANVMVGTNKGVYGHMKDKHKNIFLVGCTLHTIHNAARKAAKQLPAFEEVLVDIFHYFKKSSYWLDRFKGDQEMCGLDQKMMLKHVCTHWLSISRLVSTIIHTYS